MPKPSISFLMYHELEIPGRKLCQSDPGYARYVLPEPAFRAQMEFLKRHGWKGLSVSESLGFPDGKNVAITFDDGCESDLLAAAPILRQNEFNATFFVTCGRLGERGYLSPAQLREIASQGFEIGCHSMTHAYLTACDEHKLRHELVDPKAQLEKLIGRPVEHFSCPGGRCDRYVVNMARTAGYRTLSTSRIQANLESADLFALGRVAILRDTSLDAFAAICEGRSLPLMRAQSTLREAAKKILGNSLYDRLRAALLERQNPSP